MNNSALQVFAGGWTQLQHAKFSNSKLLAMGSPADVYWKPDGEKAYVIDGTNENIVEFTASIPYDETTIVETGMFDILDLDNNIRGIDFNDAGTLCWLIGTSQDDVHQLNFGTGWDISTISDPEINRGIGGTNANPQSVRFSKDGFILYVSDTSGKVFAYNVTTPFDISTLTTSPSFNVDFTSTAPNVGKVLFSTDEKYLYLLSRTNDNVVRYLLQTPGDITTAVFLDSFDDLMETNPLGIHIRRDNGKKLYVVGIISDTMFSYDMSLNENNSIITRLGDELTTETGENIVYA